MPAPRHFLSLDALGAGELRALLARAEVLKRERGAGAPRPLMGKTVILLFEKPSTRTRLSFEIGAAELGAHVVFLAQGETQLGRGEPAEDTARVIARMGDALVVRAGSHATLERLAAASSVPVINALSDGEHPCQILADLQAWQAHGGDLEKGAVAWIGDANNVFFSYAKAAGRLGFELRLACPADFLPADIGEHRAVRVCESPAQAADGAQLLVTDVWVSMGDEAEKKARQKAFAGHQINAELLARAAPGAFYTHCLPAHRGEEISAELMEDHPASLIWEAAENRLHAQKALLELLLG